MREREREDRASLTNELLQRFNFVEDLSCLLNFVSMTSPTVWRIVMWFVKYLNSKNQIENRSEQSEKFETKS